MCIYIYLYIYIFIYLYKYVSYYLFFSSVRGCLFFSPLSAVDCIRTGRCSRMHSSWTSHCTTCPATMWLQWQQECLSLEWAGNSGHGWNRRSPLQWHSTMGHGAWHLTSAGDRFWQQTIPTPGGWRSQGSKPYPHQVDGVRKVFQWHSCISGTAWCSLVISQVSQSVPISLLEPK